MDWLYKVVALGIFSRLFKKPEYIYRHHKFKKKNANKLSFTIFFYEFSYFEIVA